MIGERIAFVSSTILFGAALLGFALMTSLLNELESKERER